MSAIFRAVRRPALTSNFSFGYLCFFLPVVLGVYTLCPNKWKKLSLLACSYVLFFLISGSLTVFLMLSTLSVYGLGLLLEHIGQQGAAQAKAAEKSQRKAIKQKYAAKQRMVTAAGVVLNIGILLWLKYSGFFAENINILFAAAGIGVRLGIPKYIMPIGISFYTLQALSYLLDINRGAIHADRNLLRVALFVSFFPHLVEGPICRYGDTAGQLWEAKPITFVNLKHGSQRILYGMMKKMVIADRLNTFVGTVFGSPEWYSGGIIALAALAYTVQLYMDFSGAMDGALGTAEIFGITLPENFRRPFFSRTISEFWSRWHITLGTWFKDYIFYPVTMSRKMKDLTLWGRKRLGNHFGPLLAGAAALFCVWFSNGLWHGAAWSYIFFGMYHFVLILTGNLIAPWSAQLRNRLQVQKDTVWYAGLQILRTAILVMIGELFFRAEGLQAGFIMFRRMLTDPTLPAFTQELIAELGIDGHDVMITAFTLLIVLAVSLLNERGIHIRETLDQKPFWLRWAVFYGLILHIILFGAYGLGYLPVDPMYANF